MSRKGAARKKTQGTKADDNNNTGDDSSNIIHTSSRNKQSNSGSSSNSDGSATNKLTSKHGRRTSGSATQTHARKTLFGLTSPGVQTYASYERVHGALRFVWLALIAYSLWLAYDIRLISVRMYGYLIHEFDPWFNFRAAQYMDEHGWHAFFRWFDTKSWYPLGRAVGATTFPGMQFTAVALHRVLDAVGVHMSFNDICVLIPAWFGIIATMLLGAIAHEATGSLAATAIAMLGFSIIPAHTMRSMAGEFDNECIAVSAMLLTFYVWVRALRTPRSWPIGVLAGVAYGYMVAAWGGFVFVLNMIALHASVCAAIDWLRNTYSPALLYAYSLFFIVGTALAVRVPPVGMAPFRSLEQIAAVLVFIALWTLHLSELLRRRARVPVRSMATLQLRMRVLSMMLVAILAAAAVLAPTNYFGPMTMRVRALFIRHTRTGNPLVDSVAEHQPASAIAYMQFLHIFYPMWLFGTVVLLFTNARNTRAVVFVLLYSCAAYYFSTRMSRLMIFAGPVSCVCGGNLFRILLDAIVDYLFWPPAVESNNDSSRSSTGASNAGATAATATATAALSSSSSQRAKDKTGDLQGSVVPVPLHKLLPANGVPRSRSVAVVLVTTLIVLCIPLAQLYNQHATLLATEVANPRIVMRARDPKTGGAINIDDYLRSYLWLKDNTPDDARVLAWWDYGYQITGIGNRTTLADGNTWHHEHIATVGKMLVAPVNEAHALIRHVADYVLIWAGQRADDLMKTYHMVHIANSVYHDICQGDPHCQRVGFYNDDPLRPTPRMRQSLLYNLHGTGVWPGVFVDPKLFQLVYQSPYGLVRIFKVMNVSEESKAWSADPANRVCRPPPYTWWCEGQFPPVPEIQEMLSHRVNYGAKLTPEQERWLRDFHASPAQQRRSSDDSKPRVHTNSSTSKRSG